MANAVQTVTPSRQEIRPRQSINWTKVFAWIAGFLLVLIILFPFYWAVRTSLTTSRQLLSGAHSLLPVGTTTNNYARVLGLLSTEEAMAAGGSGQSVDFLKFMRNTIIVTSIITVGQLFFSSLAAYAFARLQWPGRDRLFMLFIAALMVPGMVTLIPNFVLVRNLGWLNTFQGIIAPSFLMTPFAIFFMRQFFLGINRELEEAAKLDGANPFDIFWRIILPISQPPLITLAIITFITYWNDYLWPLIVGRDESVRVLTVALGVFKSQTPQGSPDWTGLMAGTILATIPVVIIFFFMGRRVVDSIQFSGYK